MLFRSMDEAGVSLDTHRSKLVSEFDDLPMDVVVTVCDSAREACPFFPARDRQMHQSFEDPSATEGSEQERIDAFRRVRDEIQRWIQSEFVGPERTS